MNAVLTRDDYFAIINDLMDLEKQSVPSYLDEKYGQHTAHNEFFVEILYKDINFILEGLDGPGDNDLEIENGDFKIQDGDFVLTGYQSSFHDAMIWLHQALIEKYMTGGGRQEQLTEKLDTFKRKFLSQTYYSPDYLSKLKAIKKHIKNERVHNTGGSNAGLLARIFDSDNLELKPNIMGLGFNFNEIINRLRGK